MNTNWILRFQLRNDAEYYYVVSVDYTKILHAISDSGYYMTEEMLWNIGDLGRCLRQDETIYYILSAKIRG